MKQIASYAGWVVSLVLAALKAYDSTRPKATLYDMMMFGVTTVYTWVAAVVMFLIVGEGIKYWKRLINKK